MQGVSYKKVKIFTFLTGGLLFGQVKPALQPGGEGGGRNSRESNSLIRHRHTNPGG